MNRYVKNVLKTEPTGCTCVPAKAVVLHCAAIRRQCNTCLTIARLKTIRLLYQQNLAKGGFIAMYMTKWWIIDLNLFSNIFVGRICLT